MQDLIEDKSTLVQVMAWCHQAPSHYLSQCWPRSMSPYGITRSQWVKVTLTTNWQPLGPSNAVSVCWEYHAENWLCYCGIRRLKCIFKCFISKLAKNGVRTRSLTAMGDCTTTNDVVILQTVPIPKVTLLWRHDKTKQNTAVVSRRPSAPWWHGQLISFMVTR